jgi:type IV pilus assembly protein PilW
MSIHTIKSFSFSHRDFPVAPCYQAGLSLIELMISIAIGLLLLAGVTALIVQQNSTRTELDKSTRQIENGRYAIQSIQDELQFAGYYGEFPNAGTTAVSTPVSLPNPCATTDAALLAAISLHIQGYDSPTTVPSPLSTCLNNANHLSGTDILVIRRTDTATLAPASAAAGQAYMQTTLGDKILGIGTTTTYGLLQKDGATLANLRKYFVKIYQPLQRTERFRRHCLYQH